MKKITLLLLLSIFSFGCSDDDSNTTQDDSHYEGSLVGEWREIATVTGTVTDDTSSDDCSVATNTTRYNHIFRSNNTWSQIKRCDRNDSPTVANYTFTNHVLSINYQDIIGLQFEVYNAGNNKIKLRRNSDDDSYYIVLEKI
jgi:hypothetical protein